MKFLGDLESCVSGFGLSRADAPFFRGHSNQGWELQPTLSRELKAGQPRETEGIAYYEFISKGAGLLPPNVGSWDSLFLMQHYGLPTRLLDWSESFATAVYFALGPYRRDPQKAHPDAAIWVLEPYELNRETTGSPTVVNPAVDFAPKGSYKRCFIDRVEKFPYPAVAVMPTHTAKRVAAQRGVFTLHSDFGFDVGSSKHAHKLVLPAAAFKDATKFLRLAGVNEFSIFPDLDGLGRHLRDEIFSED